MSARPLFVAGFGRCGTTLLMTMLDAGGFPVAGPRPAYEVPEFWTVDGPDAAWLEAQRGRAVKWILPSPDQVSRVTRASRPLVLLMTRDLRQQARSQVKLLAGVGMSLDSAGGERGIERQMERSLRRDLPVLRARLRAVATVHELAFETLLRDPGAVALLLADMMAAEFGFTGFDIAAAQRVVIDRSSDCLPDFRMENMILPLVSEWIGRRRAA